MHVVMAHKEDSHCWMNTKAIISRVCGSANKGMTHVNAPNKKETFMSNLLSTKIIVVSTHNYCFVESKLDIDPGQERIRTNAGRRRACNSHRH